jgi:hypothetical protein
VDLSAVEVEVEFEAVGERSSHKKAMSTPLFQRKNLVSVIPTTRPGGKAGHNINSKHDLKSQGMFVSMGIPAAATNATTSTATATPGTSTVSASNKDEGRQRRGGNSTKTNKK